MLRDHDKLSDDKIEEIRSGVEALQQDISRRNTEEELQKPEPGEVFTKREREEIKTLVQEAMLEFFQNFGIRGKNTVVTTAVILSSLVGIVVAIKTILGWLWFGAITK